MSSSIPSHKFLLDENVKKALFDFLKGKGIDIRAVPKSIPDTKVAAFSKSESKILITNDEDFKWYSAREIFSVVWLRIPQKDTISLLNAFEKLLTDMPEFAGNLIILDSNGWKAKPLIKKLR